MLKVAEHLIAGSKVPPVRYPAQLTGTFAEWSMQYLDVAYGHGLTEAQGYAFGNGPRAVSASNGYAPIDMGIGPALPHFRSLDSCGFTPRRAVRKVIHGYPVEILRLPAFGEQQLCAPDADGLRVEVSITGKHPATNVIWIFSHLRLFGPDPANWPTKPA